MPYTTASIQIIPALPEEADVLSNLIELYAYDFSAFMDLKLGEDGRFGYPQLPLYWTDPQRFPFFIRVGGRLAGFVLVRKGSQVLNDPDTWDMAEFFIVRSQRRSGAGMGAAHEVWRLFPGKWEVRVSDRNTKAKPFWAHSIAAFLGRPIHPTGFLKNGENWLLFSFDSNL